MSGHSSWLEINGRELTLVFVKFPRFDDMEGGSEVHASPQVVLARLSVDRMMPLAGKLWQGSTFA